MNLAEILKRKASGKKEERKEEPKIEQKEEVVSISYTSIEAPDPDLFFLAWAPYLANPFGYDFKDQNDFEDFLLDGKGYVIDLFVPLDTQKIFELYQSIFHLTDYEDLNWLCYFCWQLELSIPRSYQDRVEDWIKKKLPRPSTNKRRRYSYRR